MKTEKDFIRVFNPTPTINRPGYGEKYEVKFSDEYEPIMFDWIGTFFVEGGGEHYGMHIEEPTYHWGGLLQYNIVLTIRDDDFDDNLTDEQMIEKFIELVKERKPYLLKRKEIL